MGFLKKIQPIWSSRLVSYICIFIIYIYTNEELYYSESHIYEYIARVFYNVVFSTYLGSNASGNEFNILIAFLHTSGLLIYLELKIKSSFSRVIKKLMTLQWYLDIFSQIVFNPLKLQTSQQLSFLDKRQKITWNGM